MQPLLSQVKKRYRALLFSLFVFSGMPASVGQIRNAVVGIDGLTCSACSFGTERAIRQLDFVKDVKMDLNKHVAEIIFQPSKKVRPEAIAQKITEAGFSVRNFFIGVQVNNLRVRSGECYPYDDDILLSFVGVEPHVADGNIILQLVGKDYMSKSAFRKYQKSIKPCTGHDQSARVYTVTR
jgi:copper chaperone CopZ